MRILMVHPHDISSSSEPWTRRIKSIAKELAINGHQVRLAYFSLSCGAVKKYVLDGYEAIAFRRKISPGVFLKNIFILIKHASWADIVHFQKCHYYSAVPTVVAACITGKQLHYDWDDWEEMIWYESCGENTWYTRFVGLSFKVLERFLPVVSDTISVSSQYLRGLSLKFGARDETIYSASVGADLNEFKPGIDGSSVRKKYSIVKPLVLYIGQLHGGQYIDLFIKAANVILHKNPDISFMIVGEGFMKGNLKSLALQLGISDKVIFTGAVPHYEIPLYISAADVCVAAFKDTKAARCKSPLKIVEYMACGKAIVASSVGEARRMLGGVGVLVQPDNASALAEGILTLIDNRDLKERLGKFARIRAEEKYSWSKTTANLLNAYQYTASNTVKHL